MSCDHNAEKKIDRVVETVSDGTVGNVRLRCAKCNECVGVTYLSLIGVTFSPFIERITFANRATHAKQGK